MILFKTYQEFVGNVTRLSRIKDAGAVRNVGTQVYWPDFTFPAINLYNYPRQTRDYEMNTSKPVWKLKVDVINNPQHYMHGSIQTWDVIDAWKLGFNLGNVVKYISRADHKGKRLEDLKKARAYLDREIMKHDNKN